MINGQKVWISRVQHSDLMILLARTTPLDQVTRKSEGMSIFLVDLHHAIKHGMTVRPIPNMVNHETNELFFDNLEIPVENLIGEEGKGFKYILDGLNAERTLIAAECIGDGYWFIDKVAAYAKERTVFGRPIGQNQGVQFPIARAYVNVEAANLMRFEACRLFDAHEPCGAQANMAKLLAADASWEAANACLQFHGGFGFANEYDVERKFRETRLYQVAPISTNLILSYVAEHILGLPAPSDDDERLPPPPQRRAGRLRGRAALRGHSRAGAAARRGPAAGLPGLHPGRRLGAGGAGDRALCRRHGPGRRPQRGADHPPAHHAAVRGHGQRRRRARGRAGRCAQRLGVPPRRRGVPAGAGRGPGAGPLGTRPADRRRGRLRGRHPRRRISAVRTTRSSTPPAPPAPSPPPSPWAGC